MQTWSSSSWGEAHTYELDIDDTPFYIAVVVAAVVLGLIVVFLKIFGQIDDDWSKQWNNQIDIFWLQQARLYCKGSVSDA